MAKKREQWLLLTCSLSTVAAGGGNLTLDSTNPSDPLTINSPVLPLEDIDICLWLEPSCLPGAGWRLHPLASTFRPAALPPTAFSMKTGEESHVLVSRCSPKPR